MPHPRPSGEPASSPDARHMWTCPAWGAKFVTRNLWHSCGLASLDDWKRRMGPRARECTFALPYPMSGTRFARVWEVAPGWWAHGLRITNADQLDEELEVWLKESYRLMGMQERLAGRG